MAVAPNGWEFVDSGLARDLPRRIKPTAIFGTSATSATASDRRPSPLFVARTKTFEFHSATLRPFSLIRDAPTNSVSGTVQQRLMGVTL